MKRFMLAVFRVDVALYWVAGLVLACMMLVTLSDVIMRNLGRPIVGTLEIISFFGSVVVGFAIPYASWKKVHVFVDFLVAKLTPRNRKIMEVITRCMGIVLFVFISYNFVLYGLDLRRTQEVTPSFRIPYYPIPFGLSFSCLLESITLVADLINTIKKEDQS